MQRSVIKQLSIRSLTKINLVQRSEKAGLLNSLIPMLFFALVMGIPVIPRDHQEGSIQATDHSRTPASVGASPTTNKLMKLGILSESRLPIAGKAMTPFRVSSSFEWIDKETGRGKARVEIESRSFVEQVWHYQWILPSSVSTQTELEASFDSPRFRKTQVFELEVAGLDSAAENQNLFLRLKPALRNDSSMSIVIPTQAEKTTEHQVKQAFAKSLKIQALRKSIANQTQADRDSSSPKIQF